MNGSGTLYGSVSELEAKHSLEGIKNLARVKGLSTVGTKREIILRIFRHERDVEREARGVTPPAEQTEAIYHVPTQRDFPTWKEVKGVFVGGCVARGVGSSFRRRAHAHCMLRDPHFGWICFRSLKRVGKVEDHMIVEPSRLLWHEYAHILTPDHYHDDEWRKTMKFLGQPIPDQYKKKKRPRRKEA